MNTGQRSLLGNLNRGLILALTLTGLVMDGYQGSDLPCTFAVIVWLWLPLCTRIEANVLNQVRANLGHSSS